MADRIGKYEIVERIGRGGMGTVYKARDTRLNRMVALKVVSPEVELTDELRTRFFDEAQACAGLSHPNIVTIYDVGEEDDRLYIVMELLDGQELKRMIADHVVISLEEKVSVMIQLCDALSYAHDKGIIHRDIKPGNILFQRTGPAKIIDFGIAKMATSSSLTRTGLIMGTLRYMSPEQVRGRADARSDQFSLAAVFYEMLSYRPPYIGEDPIQLLEQLRTESPPSLLDLDPSIPPELARVVERGMNKESDDRYPDLRSMRDDLEVVQRRIHEESQRLRKRFAALVTEVQEADAAAAARIGGAVFEDPFTPTDTQPLIVSLKDKIAAAEQRLEALRDFTNKVDSLESAVQRGRELLHGDQFTEARTVLEAVVREIPQHVVARSILEQARLGEDLKRRRLKTRELLDEATRALHADDLVRCLSLIQSAADLPAIPEAEEEIAALRRAAKTAQSEQDASRRARQQAERAREQVNDARKHAEKQDATTLADAAWANACATNDQGEEHFREERYSEALLSFDSAAEAFAAAEEEARERKLEQQRAADQAKVAEREQLANRLLDEVRTEFAGRAYVRCQEILRQVEEIPPPDSVRDEYRRLAQETEAALQNERRSRKPAQQARMLMTAMRVDAQAEGAPDLASSAWQDGEAKAATGSAAFVREMFAEAREVFESATDSFQRALDEARAAKSVAPSPSPPEAAAPAATAGEALLAEARSALDKGLPDVCMDLLARAAMSSPPPEVQEQINALLRTAAEAAREKQAPSRSESERKRARAARAAEQLEEALQLATRLGEPVVAPRIWAELEKKIASARVTFGREDFDAAFEDYEAAIQLCQRFSDAARAAEKARTADGAATVVRMPEPQRTTALDDATVFRAPSASRTSRTREARPERSNLLLVALAGGAVLAVLVAVFFPRSAPQQARVVAQEFDPNAAPEAPTAADVGNAPAAGGAAVVAATGDVDDKAIGDAQTAAEAKAAADERAKTEANARAVAETAAEAQARAEQETRGEAAKAQADADAKAAAQARAAAEEKAAAEARAVMEARIAVEEKSAALARAEEAVRAQSDSLAKEKAAAQARAEAEARLTAREKAEAEARESVKDRMAEQARQADEEIAAAKAKAEVEAKARAEARAAAEAKADAEASRKLAAEAKAAAAARAAEQDKIEADARAKAKREADALARARRELEAEEQAEAAKQARDMRLARAPLAEEVEPEVPISPPEPIVPKGKGLLKGAHASVFVEATDGMKGGGAWGACWRTDPSAARSCAKSGCEQTRSTGRACQEIATTQPGGYCAVARASGFGVSSGFCGDSASAAEGGAVSACLSKVRGTYGAVQASCKVVWSTDR